MEERTVLDLQSSSQWYCVSLRIQGCIERGQLMGVFSYSHGFLFPSEVSRVRRALMSYLGTTPQDVLSSPWLRAIGANAPTPSAWAHSSVSTFGVRYAPPLPDLPARQTVEALVEGSEMSLLREGGLMTTEYAWTHREGRAKRYEGKRVGGTVVVHFVKEHAWYLETALALLEGEEVTDAESKAAARAPFQRSEL